MDIINGILLGILQGITEFLPISSSGHSVLLQKLLGFEKHDLLFDVVVHFASLLSIFTIMSRPIGLFLNELINDIFTFKFGNGTMIFLRIVVATLPVVIVGLLFKDFLEGLFESTKVVGIGFLITAGLLFATRSSRQGMDSTGFFNQEVAMRGLAFEPLSRVLIIGLAQVVAITPGISRSGTTISTGLLVGLQKSGAAYFSFLMAIPAILGATVLEVKEIQAETLNWPLLISGFISSYLAGLFGLWFVIKTVKSGRLDRFAYYLVPLGIFTLLYF